MKTITNIALFFGVTFALLIAAGFVAKLYWSVFMLGWSLL